MVIEWSEAATSSVEQIFLYLKNHNMGHLVTNTQKGLARATSILLTFPHIGRTGRIEGTRELVMPHMPFVIVYRVSANIEILNVVHTSRDFILEV
jgi:toxin ParE1/3/4